MDQLRKVFNGQEADGGESGLMSEVTGNGDSCCPSLSWETRIKGFIACCVIGIFLSIFGVVWVFFGNYVGFGLLYSLGTLVTLCGTGFLRGPQSQLKAMFKDTRIIATIVMLISIILTMVAAFAWKSGVLCILFCVIQFLAFTWYSISYIPFARKAVKGCVESCLG